MSLMVTHRFALARSIAGSGRELASRDSTWAAAISARLAAHLTGSPGLAHDLL